MPRYSKTYSNYLLRKVHTKVNGGTIFERDWGTLGERHVIEPGKKKIYTDGHFLFTENKLPGLKKRNFTGEWSNPYTLDDLDPNVNGDVNDTSILSDSNDIRDYAYYGSAAELVRATIEKIIREFPGRLYSVDARVIRPTCDNSGFESLVSIQSDGSHNYTLVWDDSEDGLWSFENPFEMDLYRQDAVMSVNENRMRCIPISWSQYTSGGSPLTAWNVWIKPLDGCENNYDVIYEIVFKEEGSGTEWHIWGLRYNRGVVWCTDRHDMDIHPKDTIIESYFAGLEGFEAKLLSRRTEPQYTSKFVTPVKDNEIDERYRYPERRYTWPSSGYCIDVGTVGYFNYVERLTGMARTMDGLWCDNLWENMTHEAIKNFDWTYTRDYEEGDEEENVLGGSRMEGMLRIMGRFYDDIKRYIDGISLKNVVTYDGVGNVSNAELSDKAGLLGWEVFSTKQADNSNITIGSFAYSLQKIGSRFGSSSNVDHASWYNTLNPAYVSQNDVDNDFMRRLVLSSATVFKAKGTRHSIDMVMGLFGIGEDDYTVDERYYSVEPKHRDDVFWYYAPLEDEPSNPDDYTELEGISTMEEYLEFKNNAFDGGCPPHIFLDGKYYDLKGDKTVGEFCDYINSNKNVRRNYPDDEFSGVPLKDVFIGNTHCIVPYFSQLKLYDGNVQFETMGGWGKMTDGPVAVYQLAKEPYDYLETIPYMETVQSCGDLLNVNMYKTRGKRIYYVMDLSDLSEFTDTIPNTVSHFFKLADPYYPQLFSSWKNVPVGIEVSNPQEIDNYCSETTDDGVPVRGLMFGVTYTDYMEARYLDKIRLDNVGNNPHVGFGLYDLGLRYREYLEKPFKYVSEHYGFSDFSLCDIANQFRYTVTEHCGEKIKNLVHGDDTDDEVVNFNCMDDVEDCVTFNCAERYYEPRKILIITNNIDSNEYKWYFMNVILKYLLQVIASTTILVLVGFKPDSDCVRFVCSDEGSDDGGGGSDDGGGGSDDGGGGSDDDGGGSDDGGGGSDDGGGGSDDGGGGSDDGGGSGIKYRCWVKSMNPSQGTVQGDGYYPYYANVTIEAFPNTGYAFKYWIVSDGFTVTNSYTNRQTIVLKTNMQYAAVFKEAPSGGGGSGDDDGMVTVKVKVSPPYSGYVSMNANNQTKPRIDDEYEVTVPTGDRVIVRAHNTDTYEFKKWSGGGTTTPYQLNPTSDTTITAYFEWYEVYSTKWISSEEEAQTYNLSDYHNGPEFSDSQLPMTVPIPTGSMKKHFKVMVPKHHTIQLEYFNLDKVKITASFVQNTSDFTLGIEDVPEGYKVQWYNFQDEPEFLESGEGVTPPRLVIKTSVGA